MKEYKLTLMRVKEWFRKNPQTNWGKNQIIKVLDEMEDRIEEELIKEIRGKRKGAYNNS